MSRIDSSVPLTVQSVGGDDEIHPGDTLRLRGATTATESADVWVMPAAPDPTTRPSRPEKAGEARRIGSLPGLVTWTAGEPGTYQLATGPNPRLDLADYRRDDMDVDTGIIRYEVTAGEGTSVNPDDYLNTHDPGPSPSDIATNNPGIVPADNDEGIALAPELRRAGADLGPEGATVTLPNGDTVDVGGIEESDEVARYLDGEQAGNVVEADQGAVDDPTSSGGSGLIGGAVAVVLLLVAGAAAVLGGGD